MRGGILTPFSVLYFVIVLMCSFYLASFSAVTRNLLLQPFWRFMIKPKIVKYVMQQCFLAKTIQQFALFNHPLHISISV